MSDFNVSPDVSALLRANVLAGSTSGVSATGAPAVDPDTGGNPNDGQDILAMETGPVGSLA